MFESISDKELQIIINYIRQEKSLGKQNREIIDAIENKGVSRLQATHLVENSESIRLGGGSNSRSSSSPAPSPTYPPGEEPNMGMAILGTIAGIIALIAGIGITAASDGQVFTYGLIIVGALWTIRGLMKVAAAASYRK